MATDSQGDRTRTLNSVENTFRILEALKRTDGAGLSELAEIVDMSHSSVYHYLLTLEEQGYVVKRDKEYSLGIRFFSLGGYARQRRDIYREAREKVTELAAGTGETARLVVEHKGHCITLYQASDAETTTPNTYAGFEEKPHSTGAGKAILAALPPERAAELLAFHEMTARTEHTTTDEERLYEELETVRSQGYAVDDRECFEGWFCVADSVVTPDDSVIGAISVSAPVHRIDPDSFVDEIVPLLTNVTGVLGINHTYSHWEQDNVS
jgi:DNA-binding IclR family transcriptional regulator